MCFPYKYKKLGSILRTHVKNSGIMIYACKLSLKGVETGKSSGFPNQLISHIEQVPQETLKYISWMATEE